MALSLRRFLRNQDGAVTVDFVVLTGVIVFLAVATFIPVREAVVVAKDNLAVTVADATSNP